MQDEMQVGIACDVDIVTARQRGRELAAERGFDRTDQTLIATAISEIARNIVEHADRGEITFSAIDYSGRRGILILARDEGPGIADIEMAMRDGYSTGKSSGMGLPGAKRLMDEFEVESQPGSGTTVTMKKWVR